MKPAAVPVDKVVQQTAGTGPALPRMVVLSGGFGGARLIRALSDAVPARSLCVIANVGDDLTWLGLRVCPDVDSILYSLAGLWDEAAGWGRRDETFRVRATLAALAAEPWFKIGDRDLGLHLLRTDMLRSGLTLTEATRELSRRLGVSQVAVIPASDQPCETQIVLEDGRELHFQEWYVRESAQPPVRQVRLSPGPASPAALEALRHADTVVLGPSSPVASIGPILALDGMRDAVRQAPCRIAVCPVVLGVRSADDAVRHHARARQLLLAAAGAADTPAAIASRYAGLVQHFVLDRTDAGHVAEISRLGLRAVTCDLLSARELAGALASVSAQPSPPQPAASQSSRANT
jgi:LPPG:FO 2-phospho-L-lactate transferase